MIPKIIGYYLKETYDGKAFYWKHNCVGYVDSKVGAGVFTVRELKAGGIDHGLRHSLKHTKRLRLVPIYAKEAV